MSTIIVTGGAGFIGSHLVDELVARNHKIVVLDDLSGGFVENVPDGVDFVQGSVLDEQLLKKLFDTYEFEYVFHFAAYAAEGLSHFIKRFNYRNNLIGSVNLINESILHQVKCFVFASSIAVYGANDPPLTEEMVPYPEDPYGIAKLAVERELAVSRSMFGLEHMIFRFHNVYGERQNIGDKYRNVIGIFMNQIMQGRPMTIFGDGSQTRAFTYIGDVAPLIADSIHKTDCCGEVFNIGGEQPSSILDLAKIVAGVMNVECRVRHLKPRQEVCHAYCDHSKLKKYFGESGSTPLEEGISRMAAWAREIGPRKAKSCSTIEIHRNLPDGWEDDAG